MKSTKNIKLISKFSNKNLSPDINSPLGGEEGLSAARFMKILTAESPPLIPPVKGQGLGKGDTIEITLPFTGAELILFVHFSTLMFKISNKFSLFSNFKLIKLKNKDILGVNISFFYIIDGEKHGDSKDNPFNFVYKIPSRNLKFHNHDLIVECIRHYFTAYDYFNLKPETKIELVNKNFFLELDGKDIIINLNTSPSHPYPFTRREGSGLPKYINSVLEFKGTKSNLPFTYFVFVPQGGRN